MEFLKIKNNAVSRLAANITNTATSLAVSASDGALFPSTYPFHISIGDEILSCTNRSTDTLTVVRAQQGTTAAAHTAGDSVELRITAKHLDDITDIFALDKIVCHGEAVICHENNVVLS